MLNSTKITQKLYSTQKTSRKIPLTCIFGLFMCEKVFYFLKQENVLTQAKKCKQ